MIVKLLTEYHIEFLSLKGGCRGSSESTLVKMSNCWKSHVAAKLSQYTYTIPLINCFTIFNKMAFNGCDERSQKYRQLSSSTINSNRVFFLNFRSPV